MFSCSKCSALESERDYLRGQVKEMTNRLMALATGKYYSEPSAEPLDMTEYYGGGNDQYVGYDDAGAKVILEKDIELK